MSQRGDELITLATFIDLASAQVARIALEGEGIPCLVLDQNQAAHPIGALIGIRVQVLAEDKAAARAILKECGLYSFDDPDDNP
jgi:hypothetical protein